MSKGNASDDDVLVLVCCPECEAAVDATAKRCWLCGHAMDSPFKGQPSPVARPAMLPAAALSQEAVGNISLAILAVVLVMVTAAVWYADQFSGFCLAVIVLPALGITLFAGLIARLSGRAMTPLRRVLVFLYSAAAAFAVATVLAAIAVIVVAVMVISAIIAMFQACFGG